MVRIISRDKGEETIEDMNHLANFLLSNGFAVCEAGCGFQEGSYALCDFEIHVIKKKARRK